jgi:hypothetical protein
MQSHPVPDVVGLVIRSDPFDVHGRRKFVEGKIMWIKDANAANTQEPQLAIRGPCDIRAVTAREPMSADSIGIVKHGRLYCLPWMGDPGVQLRPGDPHEAASHVKPD